MSDLPEMRRLKLEDKGDGVLLVRFDRPEVMNALDTATSEDLRDLFGPLSRAPGPWRCIVLTGTGDKAFSAGGDLKERQGMTDDQWRAQHAIIEQGAYGVMDCVVPIIAAVNGVAFGGGCELALACDFIYAADTARFALPEVTRGIMPGAGSTQTLPRAVGERRARELIMTGAPFSAAEAAEWGMVNRLLPADELLPATMETANRIARNAPVSVRQIKRSIRYGWSTDIVQGREIEIMAYNQTIVTEDRLEGVNAFNEKRAPEFKGR
ncbi:enoyl-CoA hydratase/isomerase family protein [Psychromarinibacter halotolerans]|uniref:Enoyl-CoA hydratase/isomerase family protein n=1 Tax=Psychromarinibacter halotolerans TaxID=1775175 RepID=A0ABV7GUS6_9RHOB|nr:enoyl-CoA hydratase-related protein [Psychromarinibacter halotolerans]MDF0596605.1 enoyl-CoA hydratase-related protein [Psychromarinibacter halotolerans]